MFETLSIWVFFGCAIFIIVVFDDRVTRPPSTDHGPWSDCPRCRYSLEDLPKRAACPECGLPRAATAAKERKSDFLESAIIWLFKRSPALAIIIPAAVLTDHFDGIWSKCLELGPWIDRPLHANFAYLLVSKWITNAACAVAALSFLLLTPRVMWNFLAASAATIATLLGGLLGIALLCWCRWLVMHIPELTFLVCMTLPGLTTLLAARLLWSRFNKSAPPSTSHPTD